MLQKIVPWYEIQSSAKRTSLPNYENGVQNCTNTKTITIRATPQTAAALCVRFQLMKHRKLIYRVHECFILASLILTGSFASLAIDWTIKYGLVIHKEFIPSALFMGLIFFLLLKYKKKTRAHIKRKFDV